MRLEDLGTGPCDEVPPHEHLLVERNAAGQQHPRGLSGGQGDLGLSGVGTAGSPKRRGAAGLYHLAWQLDTIDELAAGRAEITAGRGASTDRSIELLATEVLPVLRRETAPERALPA